MRVCCFDSLALSFLSLWFTFSLTLCSCAAESTHFSVQLFTYQPKRDNYCSRTAFLCIKVEFKRFDILFFLRPCWTHSLEYCLTIKFSATDVRNVTQFMKWNMYKKYARLEIIMFRYVWAGEMRICCGKFAGFFFKHKQQPKINPNQLISRTIFVSYCGIDVNGVYVCVNVYFKWNIWNIDFWLKPIKSALTVTYYA